MTILFICGSLEPGKDGVGDYTRRLAGELIYQDRSVFLLAINDKYIKIISRERQPNLDISIQTYRLPQSLKLKEKRELTQAYIKEINPEWISLQYVPFSFNNRGLPLGWNQVFRKIGRKVNWHIMFHELWLGLNKEASLKHRIMGEIQKKIIRELLHLHSPTLVATQNHLYKNFLLQYCSKVEVLPLFSNFEITKDQEAFFEKEENTTYFVIFGNIYQYNNFEVFIEELSALVQNKNRNYCFIFIGRNGNEKHRWLSLLQEVQIPQITYKNLGELGADDVSRVLQTADIAITAFPAELVEKSSSIAAYFAHQLPVICISEGWNVKLKKKLPKIIDGVAIYKFGHLEETLNQCEINNPKAHHITNVALQFLAFLNSSSNNYQAFSENAMKIENI